MKKKLISVLVTSVIGCTAIYATKDKVEVAKKKEVKSCQASYYADKFVGRKTASGQIYSHKKLTAAHRTLPLGTKVKLINPKNGKTVIVTINDRGPFAKTSVRQFDLSKLAMQELGGVNSGVIQIVYEVINPLEKEFIDTFPNVDKPEVQKQPKYIYYADDRHKAKEKTDIANDNDKVL